MSIPREFIDSVIAKIDLVDLIRQARVPLQKKTGSNFFAKCPFHQEKSASFSVSETNQFYYCFGCGASGNAIDFLMRHERLTFPEAIEMLAKQAGMEIPNNGQFRKKDEQLPILLDVMTAATQFYYEQMRQSTRAVHYLKQRGISGEIAKQFQLGYAPDQWDSLLKKFGSQEIQQKHLLDCGLVIKKNQGGFYDRFRDRIMFPIHDYRGRLIGFGGRIIDQGEPKYLNSPETSLFQKGCELYGLYQTLKCHRSLERVLIVEGYMDVIALFQHGITYAVATMGTATTKQHLERLFRYTSEIVFCFDGDVAGKKAAWRALEVLFPIMSDSLQIRFLFLPDGEDPDSWVRKIGEKAFEQQIMDATSLSQFFFQHVSEQTDINTLEGRARFASMALNYIKLLPDGLFQSILLEELGRKARIEIKELRQQIQLKDKAPSLIIKQTKTVKQKLSPLVKLALGLLVQCPKLALLVESPLANIDEPGVNFLNQLVEMIKERPHITAGGLLEHWRGQKEEAFFIRLAQWQHLVPENGFENEFLGAIRQLSASAFETEINRLLNKAAVSGLNDAEKQELAHFIVKKKEIVE